MNLVVYILTLIYGCVLAPALRIVASVVLIVASKQISKLSGNKLLLSICNIFGIAFLFFSIIMAIRLNLLFFHIMILPLICN